MIWNRRNLARWVVSTLLVVSLLLTLGMPRANAAEQDIFEYDNVSAGHPLFVPGEILVKFRTGVPDAVIERINAEHGASVLEVSPWGFMRLGIPKGRSVTQMAQVYSKNPNVRHAQPNSICRVVMSPNDFYYYRQWHLDNPEYGGINMESAWDLSTGAGVVVAVLDTGVAYENYDEDGDGNYDYWLAPDLANTTFVPGYDFINNDSHPNDDDSHGTHVTGTIAQSTNNSIGVAGVAFDASIMPVKVLGGGGSGTVFSVVNGIYFAADNGAEVINMSLAWPWWGGSMYDPGPIVHDAVIYAYNKGVTIVAAAGNDNKNEVAYPAAYAECIAVGATQYDEALAPYTNRGTALELTAPGGNLNLDQNGDTKGDGVLQQTFNPYTRDPSDFDYWFFQGTSMASPHVAGVAALVIAAGVSGPDDVRQVLRSTAEDHYLPGWDSQYGWGIVDAHAALSSIGPPNEPPVAEAGGSYSGDEGSAINFDASASSDADGTITLYEWDWDNDGVYDESTTSATITHTWYDDYSGAVGLRVTDDDGATGTDTASVTVNNVAPTAEAGGPYYGNEGSAIFLTGSATDPGSDDLTYAWDLDNNGSYETPGKNVSKTWAQDGTYAVVLRVTDGDGGVDTDNATVYVNDLDPTAAFSYSPVNPVIGELVSFTDESTSYDGITSWLWDFGDGNTSNQQNPTHTYLSASTFTVSLTVTEADTDSDMTSQSITVSETANEPPVAEAGGPYSGDEGSAINFDASASSDADGTITLYEWDWDNNGIYDESTTSATITHTWDDDYSGAVGLRVTDDDGATGTDTASVTVDNVAPTAEAGGPYYGDEGSAIFLTGSATDPGTDVLTYAWDLDNDGVYETPGKNVSKTWAQDGTYTVGLKVTDDNGGVDTDNATVTVNDLDPTAAFSYSPASPVVGETVSFTNESTSYDGITSWLWDFGDGDTSTEQNPTHPYLSASTFTVSLTVTEADGDSDMTSQSITVSETVVNTWNSGDLETAIWSESGNPPGRNGRKDYSYTPDSAITNIQLIRVKISVLTYDSSGSAGTDLVPPYLEVYVKEKGNTLTRINGRITPTAAGTYIFESNDPTILSKLTPGNTNVIRVVIGSLNKDKRAGNNDLVQVNYVEVEIEYQN